MASVLPPMVQAVLALKPALRPAPDELRKRVQSIRVRSGQDSPAWRNKSPLVTNKWRNSSGALSQISNSPGSPSGFSPGSPQINRSQSQHSFSAATASPSQPPVGRYVSKFHNGTKVGDDQILNTVILNKLNIFSVKTYDDVKQFLFQILGSDQREFVRDFTWLVFRKAAAEDKFCGLFAKLLADIQKEYPVILEEMRNLHTTYLDIWDPTDTTTLVDRRCRLGYSQFLAELTALEVLDIDTMTKTLGSLKGHISASIELEDRKETVDEYLDCLRRLCAVKTSKDIRMRLQSMLLDDLDTWIGSLREKTPGLSSKSRFACMDLKDALLRS